MLFLMVRLIATIFCMLGVASVVAWGFEQGLIYCFGKGGR